MPAVKLKSLLRGIDVFTSVNLIHPGIETGISVSYTHLDVYKRQLFILAVKNRISLIADF